MLSEILHIDTISIKVEPKHQPFLGRALVNDKKFLKIWKCLIHERGIRRFFVLFQIFSGFFSKQEFQAKGRLIVKPEEICQRHDKLPFLGFFKHAKGRLTKATRDFKEMTSACQPLLNNECFHNSIIKTFS